MKAKSIFRAIAAIGCLLLFAGCQSPVFNDYTPVSIPQNASGLYTFSFSAQIPRNVPVVAGSERAKIVINGDVYEMQPAPGNRRSFRYDYRMPDSVREARYYYVLEYDVMQQGNLKTITRYSTHDVGKIYNAQLVSRYAIQLVNDRGPVGATIALVGNGFTSEDVVVVGTVNAPTLVRSANSIEFTVPSIPAGETYEVTLRTASQDMSVGPFRVDPGRLQVQPERLRIISGDMDLLVFSIDFQAPAGGLFIDVTTDIPNSVIMPEVVIPAGARSVSITVEGGSSGSGNLFVNAPGFAPITIPVSVN